VQIKNLHISHSAITPLNLPQITPVCRRTQQGQVQIYDNLRGKFVALTPEEWVRQHFVAFLTMHKGYNPTLMANEIGLTLNGTRRRCDTVVFDRYSRPLAIVEYKAPDIAITQRVFDQIVRYNMVMQAPYLMVSNGISHYCCAIDIAARTYSFLRDIPEYSTLKIPV